MAKKNGGVCVTKTSKARGYPALCKAAIKGQQVASFGDAVLDLCVWACPPDKRKRDLDNLLKGTLDALTKCGVYLDDSQIRHINIGWLEPLDGLPEKTTNWQSNFFASHYGYIKVSIDKSRFRLPWQKASKSRFEME